MYFNRNMNGFSNIYFTQKKNNSWSAPLPVPRVNSRYNDETPFITRDGKFLIFASDRDGSTALPAGRDGRVRVSFDIFIAQKNASGWSAPIPLPGEVNTYLHERAPSFGYDGKTLYFTRWPFGDITRAVIMQATLENGRFINVKPLPAPVNSRYSDTSIYPSAKKGVFYFTSNRPSGLGGYDIYRVEYKNNRWGQPVNPGKKINSTKNEAFFSLVNDAIYFSSNRNGSYGGFDIYSSRIEKPFLVIRLVDEEAKNSITGNLSGILKSEKTERKLYDEVVVPLDGYEMEYPTVDGTITFLASKKGYLPAEKSINIKEFNGKHVIIPMKKQKKNQKFTLHTIHFASNSDVIKKASFIYLDALIRYMKENPGVRLRITGHTDLHGGKKYNINLSKKRANSVRRYLVQKGIDQSRLETRGMGFLEPLVNKKGEPHDSRNRRTDFEIISTD